jgi:phosphoglycolate phosphatase
MIKVLIFDLDGTLADTSRDITNAVNYAMEPVGQRQFSIDEVKSMVGSGISKLLESLIPRERTGQNNNSYANILSEVMRRFLHYYENHLVDNTRAYPHVKETLLKLREFKKAVVSNKREEYSKRVLEELGILGHFDLILGSDSVSEKKPSPVPVLEILKRFGAANKEAVVIGDSNFDIQAGKAAGVKTIAVTYGFRSREFLKEADFLIDSFDEILSVLPKIED